MNNVFSTAAVFGPPYHRLPGSAHVGRVRVAVSKLDQSLSFYTEVIGLTILRRSENFAELGAAEDGRTLLELEQLAGVQPILHRTRLGLYHTAFLLPRRADLSSFAEHLNRLGVPFGAGDHLVSEALYLTDPDGLGVEVYSDRRRGEWMVREGQIVIGTKPVVFGELLALPHQSWAGVPSGTAVGHIHFYVGDLEQAASFYHSALGMDIMTANFSGALFVAAGGYHHHVGLNIWAASSEQASQVDARILFWELILPNLEELDLVATRMSAAGWKPSSKLPDEVTFTDPWGITLLIAARQQTCK